MFIGAREPRSTWSDRQQAHSSAVIHQREASASPSPRLLAVNLMLELALGGAWTGGWRADDRRALAESLAAPTNL